MHELQASQPKDLTLSREKIELIKQTVAKGATDLELELFFHACRRTGLDPLMKQIYAMKRWNSSEGRESLTFQTGIDGYRLIADRTGLYAGSSDAEYEINGDGYPIVAKVTVTKVVSGEKCHFSASARWDEYCQVKKDGQPTPMWKKMPFLMLGKCAESLALRKAFPAELSGVYTHEEMAQADEEKTSFRDNKKAAITKISEIAIGHMSVEHDGASVSQSSATVSRSANQKKLDGLKQAQPVKRVTPKGASGMAEQSVGDEQWDLFLEYMNDDEERTNVGKQLKSILLIDKVSDLSGDARRSFMLEYQKACLEVSVPCSEWVTQ